MDQIDWPGIKAAAIALQSIRKAAAAAAESLPEPYRSRLIERIRKRAQREAWLPRNPPPLAGVPVVPLSLEPVPTAPRPPATVAAVDGATIVARVLARNKARSAVHLSKYVADASKNLARSRGRLNLARSGRDLVAIRGNVWPETLQATEQTLEVKLDDSGRVESLHARLRSLLGNAPQ